MRFGFQPDPRSDYTALSTLAQHAESIGWHSIRLADHFLPDEDELIPVHESWITMAALARDSIADCYEKLEKKQRLAYF